MQKLLFEVVEQFCIRFGVNFEFVYESIALVKQASKASFHGFLTSQFSEKQKKSRLLFIQKLKGARLEWSQNQKESRSDFASKQKWVEIGVYLKSEELEIGIHSKDQ